MGTVMPAAPENWDISTVGVEVPAMVLPPPSDDDDADAQYDSGMHRHHNQKNAKAGRHPLAASKL